MRTTVFSILLTIAAAAASFAAPAPEVEIAVFGVDEVFADEARGIWADLSPAVVDAVWPYARPPGLIRVELHDTAGFRARTGGWIQDWGVGVATNDWIAVDVTRVDAVGHTLAHVLMHELVHCLLSQGLRGVDDVPAWFHEGVAQNVAGEWKVRDAVSLVLSGGVPDLRTLEDRFPSSAGWADRAYRTSLLAASRLDEWYGPDVVPDLVLAARARGSFGAAFGVVTGDSPAEFAERFGEEIRLKYGWLFIVTRWPTLFVIMALVFLGGAALKRRRDLARMKAMPDEEPQARSRNRLWPEPDSVRDSRGDGPSVH